MRQQTDFFPLRGGLNLATPAIETPAGHCIAASNYEPHPRGYQRIDGYERLDGQAKPSEASYWILNFDAGTVAVAEDAIVTGATSGATGRAVIGSVLESGTYAGNDAAGYLVLMAVSGTFQDDEALVVTGATNLATNGTFDTDTDWTKGTDWTIGAGVATKTAGTAASLAQDVGAVAGNRYYITFDLTVSAGALIVRLGSTANQGSFTTSGAKAVVATCGATDAILDFLGTSAFAGTIDNVEIVEAAAAANGVASERGSDTDANDSTWLQSSIEKTRADIDPVPGSGPVRGVFVRRGNHYAVRDNAGATAGILHLATAAGWATGSITLTQYLFFNVGGGTTGADLPVEGDQINGATSGAVATVHRVGVFSGSVAGNDAAGYFVLTNVTGTFQDTEKLRVGASGGTTMADADGASVQFALAAGGTYKAVHHNFFGSSGSFRSYVAASANPPFEIDENHVVSPIFWSKAYAAAPFPNDITVHREHLFIDYPGGIFRHSGPGDPFEGRVSGGAGEFGLGEEPTGMIGNVSGALAIFGENKVAYLFGDDAANWVLKTISDDSGAVSKTAQKIGEVMYLDANGVRSMGTTDQFGDFKLGNLTRLIEPLFRRKRTANVSPAGTIRVRNKDQYRLYWDDKTGFTLYFGRGGVEAMPFEIDKQFVCFGMGEDASGREVILAGCANGYVYQIDSGTSFDGAAIPAFARFPFNHVGSPTQQKRWHNAILELDGGPQTQLSLTAEFAYADPDQPPSREQTFDVDGAGGFWEEALWDQFFWSSPVEGRAESDIDGLGQNVSVTVVSNAIYEEPHVIHGMILNFSYRRLMR